MIGRQEFQIVVTGADDATAQLKSVGAANDAAGAAARRHGDSLEEATEWTIRQRMAEMEAERAIVQKVRAEQSARKAFEDALRPQQAIVKETTALGKAGQLASSGLTALRRAAEIIPGMELGTILAGVAAGAYAIYRAMDDGAEATARQTAQFEAQTVAARNLAQAQRDLLKGEIGAGAAGLTQALDRMGSGLSPEVRDQIIRLSAQRQQSVVARAEAVQRAVRAAGGLVPTTDAEQARVEALQSERNKVIEQAEARDEDGDFELSEKERRRLAVKAQAFQLQAETIRKEAERANARGWDDIQNAQRNIEELDARLRSLGVGSDVVAGDKGSGDASREAEQRRKAEEKARLELAARVEKDRGAFARSVAPEGAELEAILPGMRERSLDESAKRRQAASEEALQRWWGQKRAEQMSMSEGEASSLFGQLAASNDDRDRWEEDLKSADSGLRSIMDLAQQASAGVKGFGESFGQGMAQAAAAAIITGGSFKQMANMLLKSLAVQAGAQALWETAKGVGNLALAAWGVPNAGAAATLHFQAAGMYAGLAAAFAGGAALSGGLRSGGGSHTAGGGIQNAGASNPYQPQGGSQTQVTVIIGSEVVTRGVHVEERRQAMRGGISEGRRAAA